MRAYSTDLRERIVLAYESDEGTLDEIAATFAVGRCTVARMLKLYRAGESLAPKLHGGGCPSSLDERALRLLSAQVQAQPDARLAELAAFLKRTAGVQVHLSTVCRALQKLDLPRKKTLASAERVEADRRAFRRQVARLDRRRFVFTDETGFHLAMTRLYGRARPGQRVIESVPKKRGSHVSLIGSLALRGLVSSLSLEGAVDTLAFDVYLLELLVPNLQPDDIVFLDRLAVHRASQIEAAVATVPAQVKWLPAYSPDFSPLENCWSKVKAQVRGDEPRTPNALNTSLKNALNALTSHDIEGWFKHCGY